MYAERLIASSFDRVSGNRLDVERFQHRADTEHTSLPIKELILRRLLRCPMLTVTVAFGGNMVSNVSLFGVIEPTTFANIDAGAAIGAVLHPKNFAS